MSLQVFDVTFDNQAATYYAGHTVTGRVVVRLAKEKKIRGIVIRLKGEAEVKWTESRTTTGSDGKSHTHHDHYRAHELYFEEHVYVVGSSHGDMTLPVGEHVYPFIYNLPNNIPSSFEGSRGFVRYTFKAKIVRPWKFDHELKRAFTVLTPFDLNTQNGIQEPMQATKEKFLCCLCCKEGPITLVANLPFRGFVPGQKIQAVIEADNNSSEIVNVKCCLVKKLTFTASCGYRTHHKREETVVAEERLGQVGENNSNTFSTSVLVPSLPASQLQYCNCIDISYEFLIKGQISGAHKALHMEIPVMVGTIPLRIQFPAIIPSAPTEVPDAELDLPPSFSEAVVSSAIGPSVPPFNPYTAYPDMPPPTYEECMLGKTNIRSDDDSNYVLGPMDFAPRYPLYRFK